MLGKSRQEKEALAVPLQGVQTFGGTCTNVVHVEGKGKNLILS